MLETFHEDVITFDFVPFSRVFTHGFPISNTKKDLRV